MFVLLDVLTVLLLAVIAFLGFKRGFVKTVLSSARLLLAILITYLLGSHVTSWVRSTFMEPSEGGLEELASDALAVVVGYVLTFLLSFVILFVVTWVLGKLLSLPVLKQCDKLLGLLLGLLSGFVAACLFSTIIWVLLKASDDLDIYSQTTLVQFFKELNLFKFVIKTLL